jgi:pimeloyl-ACP methyl ester carboxylesterase
VSRRVLWLIPALGDTGEAYSALSATELARAFELRAVTLPGAGGAPVDRASDTLDGAARWLAGEIGRRSSPGPVGLVGHSLGSALAVRAAQHLAGALIGLFSIEGNLTEADAYFSGAAAAFDDPELFRQDLVRRIAEVEEDAAPDSRTALQRYRASLQVAAAESLWRLARTAKAASLNDGLGAEYRRLGVPSLYYWSPRNTPEPTQEYVRKHSLRNVTFAGGHWPMQDQPEAVAREIAGFFGPLAAS